MFDFSFFSYVPSQSFKFVKNFFKSSSDTSGGMDGDIFDIQGFSIVDQLTEEKKEKSQLEMPLATIDTKSYSWAKTAFAAYSIPLICLGRWKILVTKEQ